MTNQKYRRVKSLLEQLFANEEWELGLKLYPFYSSTGVLLCDILYKVPRISWQDRAQALAVACLITHPCIGFSSFYLLFWSSLSRISSQGNYLHASLYLNALLSGRQSKQTKTVLCICRQTCPVVLLVVCSGIAVSKVHLLLVVEHSHEMLRLVRLFNKVMNLSILGICKELIFKQDRLRTGPATFRV